MIIKHINGLAGLARAFERLALAEPVIVAAGMAASEPVLKRNILSVYGDESVLAPLAQATRDERARLGFSEGDPLLRDGSMLRDHVESTHDLRSASVGSPEIVNAFHELGYIDAKGGASVPPRRVFAEGALKSEHEVVAIFEAEIGIALK